MKTKFEKATHLIRLGSVSEETKGQFFGEKFEWLIFGCDVRCRVVHPATPRRRRTMTVTRLAMVALLGLSVLAGSVAVSDPAHAGFLCNLHLWVWCK